MYVQAVIDSFCLNVGLFKIIKYVSVKYKPSKKYFRSLFIFSYFICETKSFTRVFYFLNWIFLNRRHFFSIRKIQKISFSDMNICKTGKCELNDIIKKNGSPTIPYQPELEHGFPATQLVMVMLS